MQVSDATLEPGMVICVELHLQHDGNPISLEDMLLITPAGTKALTNAPHGLDVWL